MISSFIFTHDHYVMKPIKFKSGYVTIEQAIIAGADYFEHFNLSFSHGTSAAIDESAWLVLEAMGLSPIEEPDYTTVLTEEEIEAVKGYFCKRAVERIPVAYITQRTWFAELEFYVDKRVLIPRSPLAEPIQYGFSDFLEISTVTSVLDLCTGGGCIAIACAYAFANATVDASDISTEALCVADINIRNHELESRVKTIRSDVFENIEAKGNYDLIVSNPPYVDKTDMDELAPEFKHEPVLGLQAGVNGLDIVRKILSRAADYLSPNGILVCEVGNSATALEAEFPDLPFLWMQFEHGGEGVFVLTRDELGCMD